MARATQARSRVVTLGQHRTGAHWSHSDLHRDEHSEENGTQKQVVQVWMHMSMHKDEHKKEERSQRGHSSTKANGLSLDWKTILCDQWSLTTPVPLSTGQSALFGLKVHGFVGGL